MSQQDMSQGVPVESVAFDLDEDGVVETVAVDTDADNVADAMAFDLDEDGVADTVAVDTDADNVADTMAFDLDEDGVIDTVAVGADADPSGGFDLDDDLDDGTGAAAGVDGDEAALEDDPMFTPPEDITDDDVNQAAADLEHTQLMNDYMNSTGVIDTY